MAHQNRNPARYGRGGASKIDHAVRLIAFEDNDFLSETQAPRIVAYVIDMNLLVLEVVRHG